MSVEATGKILSELEPTERHRVMDLVAEVGINVDAWAIKRGGQPVANPAANPAYCYEWAFGKEFEPVALCIWHESLEVKEGRISFLGNLRRLSLELESAASDRSQTEEFRSRAKAQAVRARDFDIRCQDARRLKQPIRLILLKGQRERKTSLGQDSSKVEFRRLDPEPWTLTSYDMMTGDIHLVRGRVSVVTDSLADSAPTESTSSTSEFSDQFDLESTPDRREVVGGVWIRSPQVRSAVLARSGGSCEACGQMGFRMANGAIYLETHHVVPLSEKGLDVVWNVVAVCPNDHRIAHYGEEREAWRHRMLRHLALLYPEAGGDRLRNLT